LIGRHRSPTRVVPPNPRDTRARNAAVACLAMLATVGCGRSNEARAHKNHGASSASAVAQEAPSAAGRIGVLPPAKHLLSTDGSAYSSGLASDDERIYLLTKDAAFRLAPDKAPERRPLPLGTSSVVTRDDIVYWFEGALRSVPKAGGEATLVAKLEHMPRQLVASRERVAWLSKDDAGFAIEAPDTTGVRRLYATTAYLATMALDDEAAYFVERAPDRSWRLGKVSLSGGPHRFTSARLGRTPAMLVVARALYYYDGPSRTVRRVSLDLDREDVIANDVICSPLAVAEHVYCAQPAGILELGSTGNSRRVLAMPEGATITALSATQRWLAWAADAGEGRLAVNATLVGTGD